MIEPAGSRTPPISPQLAIRVAGLSVAAFVLFAVIFFRLWFLQVLSGEDYVRQAQVNKARSERIQAPRGEIVDRNGVSLVRNDLAIVVTLDPAKLPPEELEAANRWGQASARRARKPKGRRGDPIPIPDVPTPELQQRFKRLGEVLDVSVSYIQERAITALWLAPYAPVKIRTGVSDQVRDYLRERQDEFEGVEVTTTFLRQYPYDNLAAQVFGTVNEISPDQLADKEYEDAPQGTVVGQSGLEKAYDSWLRGDDGIERILVNAQGEPQGRATSRQPVPGRQLKIALDKGLQETAQRAIARFGKPGAFVAMSPRTGEVFALGSYPSFDANVFSKPLSNKRFEELFGDAAGAPGYNRAVSGGYPTGSTFKPITALAGLTAGAVTPETPINDAGCIEIGSAGQEFCNAGKKANGTVALRRAMEVSSDIYFYVIGRDINDLKGQPLQRWARRLSLGKPTGIDLPEESSGLVPDRKWRDDVAEKQRRHEKKTGKECPYEAPCLYSDKRPWSVGDNVNLSVGQGDLAATPLQMAVAYAAIANGGRVVTPHLGLTVEDDQGRTVQEIDPPAARRIDIPENYRAAIMDGLLAAASGAAGTSTDVFSGWPHSRMPVYGKTGTAQRGQNEDANDQSWYVAYIPNKNDPSKDVVMAATIEKGGFGAAAAAPTVCRMAAKWFKVKAACAVGDSSTR